MARAPAFIAFQAIYIIGAPEGNEMCSIMEPYGIKLRFMKYIEENEVPRKWDGIMAVQSFPLGSR